jgi:hypothetical protein
MLIKVSEPEVTLYRNSQMRDDVAALCFPVYIISYRKIMKTITNADYFIISQKVEDSVRTALVVQGPLDIKGCIHNAQHRSNLL